MTPRELRELEALHKEYARAIEHLAELQAQAKSLYAEDLSKMDQAGLRGWKQRHDTLSAQIKTLIDEHSRLQTELAQTER